METIKLDRRIAPPLRSISSIALPRPEIHTLKNNIPVYLVNLGDDPVCRLDLIFDAGKFFEPKKLLSEFAAALIKSGTKTKTNLEITETLDSYGTSIKASVTNDHFIISLYTLNKYLKTALELLLELMNESSYPINELENYRKRSQQRLLVELEKPAFLASKKLNEIAYGKDHAYGYFPETENFQSITQEDLLAFNRNLLTADNCKIVVGGKIEKEQWQLIENALGQINSSKRILNNNNVAIASSIPANLFIEKEDAAQCAVRIARRAFTKKDKRFQPFLVLNTVFGGYFGSRLMDNIREEKGYTYGIYSLIKANLNDGLFLISSEIGSKFYTSAIEEIWKEINKIKNERIPDEELDLVRNYLSGVFLGGIDGLMNVTDSVRSLVMFDLPFDRLESSFELLNQISSQELQDLAIEFFDEKQFFETTVGKKVD